ncbi:hypothetical protein A5708_24795 [Mycobacterium colombiense]|uniref:Uncharacterized protein n=2 Tax=Mycobacterium colombiense TaxID=339268 RepID=A0A1A2YVD3_9MYCO|nr:hypothetical protein A5708_24795 [Mycobacterium colombiense]
MGWAGECGMTWTKLSDDFTDDCWELSHGAHRLHIDALVWSNRKLLDCRISKKDMERWAKCPAPEFISELLDCGWWEDDGDAYLIIHHSRYQRTREQVLRQQSANRNNRAQGKTRPVRERAQRVDDSYDDSSDEMDGTGRDGPGLRNRGTSLRNGQPKTDADPDADYAADYRDWCEQQP